MFGWQAWHKYQANQSQGASILYQQLLETTLTPDGKPDPAQVADLAGKLKNEFGGSTYAQYGSLFVAKVAVDTGNLDDAATELKAIADKPTNPTLGEIARQRLAQVLAAQNKADKKAAKTQAFSEEDDDSEDYDDDGLDDIMDGLGDDSEMDESDGDEDDDEEDDEEDDEDDEEGSGSEDDEFGGFSDEEDAEDAPTAPAPRVRENPYKPGVTITDPPRILREECGMYP